MKKIIALVFVAVLTAGAVFAQESEPMMLTVDQAVELAVAQNLGLKNAGIDLRTRKRAKDTTWNRFLPQMSINAGFNGGAQLFTSQGVAVPNLGAPGSIGFNTGISFDLPLNIALGSGIRTVVAEYEAGLISYEDAQRQLERDVRKQFYLILGSAENIAIQEANIDLAEKRLAQAQSNYENGLAPELEVLSAQVTLENLRPGYNQVLADYESLLLFFKFLVGIERIRPIELDGVLETNFYDFDAETLISAYIGKRLDVQALNKQIEVLDYTKKGLATNSNSPTLSLGYSYGISGSNADSNQTGPIEPWSNWTDNSTLSLLLIWRFDGLIPGSTTSVAVREVQDGIDSLNIGLQQTYENAGIEITNLVNQLDTSRRTIEANVFSVELARRNFELTEEAYRVGTRELLEVETAQSELLAAAQAQLFSTYQYIASLLDLAYALNTPVEDYATMAVSE